MDRRPIPGNTALTIAVAVAVWGGIVALAAADGVLARLDAPVSIALAAFAFAFALEAYALDVDVRAWVEGRSLPMLVGVAVAADAAFALAAVQAQLEPQPLAAFARLPFALLGWLGMPLAAVAHVAALRAAVASRLSRSAPRSRGANPAAI
ncbi:MAG TPA: hypothetical protein VEG27_05240 [Usitatibacter sp.]|nr:hypothetical protein [Usitatibacter sp.]